MEPFGSPALAGQALLLLGTFFPLYLVNWTHGLFLPQRQIKKINMTAWDSFQNPLTLVEIPHWFQRGKSCRGGNCYLARSNHGVCNVDLHCLPCLDFRCDGGAGTQLRHITCSFWAHLSVPREVAEHNPSSAAALVSIATPLLPPMSLFCCLSLFYFKEESWNVENPLFWKVSWRLRCLKFKPYRGASWSKWL